MNLDEWEEKEREALKEKLKKQDEEMQKIKEQMKELYEMYIAMLK